MGGGFGVIPRALDCERTEALADGESLELVREDSDTGDYHEGDANCLTNKVSPVQRVCVEIPYTRTRKTRVVAHPRRTLDRELRRQLQLHLTHLTLA
jgi:hypothetical protein